MEVVFNGLWYGGLRHGSRDVGQASVGTCLALLGSLGQRAFAWSIHALECPKEAWDRMVSSSIFLSKKEPMVLSELVEFESCFSAETVKACALIGLHMMAEENALRSDRDSSPDLRDMWKYGCPNSPPRSLCSECQRSSLVEAVTAAKPLTADGL